MSVAGREGLGAPLEQSTAERPHAHVGSLGLPLGTRSQQMPPRRKELVAIAALGCFAGVAGATAGCADGTREGFTSASTFPMIAACAGTFSGMLTSPASATPSVCAYGWEICSGYDVHVTSGVTYAQASGFGGCFAYNAAQDCNGCFSPCDAAVSISSTAGCPDGAAGIDRAGVGSGCGGSSGGTSCLAASGRIDSGKSCAW